MVLFFTSTAHTPPVTIYMGKDKVENEDLIKYALPTDIWFHVDKLSSAHVYLRLPEDASPAMSWEAIPVPLLTDCAQLVKANSIEGNKKDNLTIIYTPADNLKKTGDMAVGQVSFHNDKRVKRVHVPKRENPIVNRLTKTKVERVVDHEAERIERMRKEGVMRRAVATEQRKADLELAKAREAEKKAKSYDTLWEQQQLDAELAADEEGGGEEEKQGRSVREMEEDFM
ncbi:NFACT-R-1 domain-containing protein [Mycena chlorophos]|uniref:NFACT-R-1 domain-containing protein n=1 Tax=Mycena chlorophos TaxID=658473 RepID=A0A8H6VTX6_MYCCL|nr:NFACT-R-1 domain-containing protein [Mycena chlorophos]